MTVWARWPRTLGPWEPEQFGNERRAYWNTYRARCVWVSVLELRLSRTDHGLAWLMRVKAIGRTA